MRAKAKSSSTPYPIWVEGEYITEPPIRPSDGAVRPAGHYIDKGGYPGANVYEVDINTMCRQTDAADRFGKPIYEQDILLYETAEEIGYFIVQDLETTVDIVNGENIEVGDLDTENIKNIGSMVDYSDFVEGIRYHADNGLEIPYIPCLDVQVTALPYFKLKCLKCGQISLSCAYMATAVNEKGTHKYHCISQDGKGVYGWVNAESIKELSSKAHSDHASVSKGDIVTFTGGGVYKSSTAEYASVQKNVTSTCKVTAVNTKGTHPYHCISQDGKGVYGWVNAADVK